MHDLRIRGLSPLDAVMLVLCARLQTQDVEHVEAEVSADTGLMTDVIQTIHQMDVARGVTCNELQNLPEISLKLIEGKLEVYVIKTEEEEVRQISRLLGLVKPEELLSNEQLSHCILWGQAICLDFLESCDLINH